MVFSYFLSRSFLLYGKTPGKVRQLLLVNFIRGHVCITVVKMSNLFYLRLLWCKSLFQVVTKYVNNYRFFLKLCSLYRHLLIKATALMRQTWMQWIMYCSEVTSKLFCIYLAYKNSQIFNLQLSIVSRVSHFEDFK